MKKQSKKYSRPRKPFDKVRIEDENVLVERYGLKNKKEIWKADSAIARLRNQAKELITASDEEKAHFIERLRKKGFPVESIADVLALNKEDLLKRRLQTIVHQKKLSNTPKQARQFITHRHVVVNGVIVNKPSYQVSLDEEGSITCDVKLVEKEKKKSKIEEITEEVMEGSEQEVGEEKSIDEEVKEEKKEEVKEEEVVEDNNENSEEEKK